MGDFWVFGYGSLMWNPGFPYLGHRQATMHGVHRALCVRSFVHRGTEAEPGLVLGLDRGGSCHGIAFQVDGRHREQVIGYLRERELVTRVYVETWRGARLEDGQRIEALAYLVDRNHAQYAGKLPPAEIAPIVRRGTGKSGRNSDYVVNTLAHLRQIGIHDPHLEAVSAQLEDLLLADRALSLSRSA